MNMATMGRIWLLSGVLLAGNLAADTLRISSGEQRVNLVELYTSEGCSSCPPAEAWLNGYLETEGLWTDVIPLAFHVDYWDYIGWQDRFAQAQFSQRQYRYRQAGAIGAVYTPGVLLNGQEWRGGFRQRPAVAGEAAGELTLEINGERLWARFVPTEKATGVLRLHVAILAFGLTSEVRAGENRGRQLAHEFVVLALNSSDSSDLQWQMTLPGSRSSDAERHALAAWVSPVDSQQPLQAAAGWLPDKP